MFSTDASASDLQDQVNNYRDMDEMFAELDMDTTPRLVGPNWIINAPEAVELAAVLGGTVETS